MDIEQLLSPIDADQPTGIYLKGDRARFREARNAFNAAQSAFRRLIETPQSMEDEELIKENESKWHALNEVCTDILLNQSKDVEICSWWIAAQAFTPSPLSALAEGFETLNRLFDTFWPNIHPYTPDDKLKGDDDTAKQKDRVALQLRPLIQLLGESETSGLLYMPLQLTTLVDDISHADFENAKKNNRLNELKQKSQSAFNGERDEIEHRLLALSRLLAELNTLEKFLLEQQQQFGFSTISCSFLKSLINNCIEAIRYLVGAQFSHWPLDESSKQAVTAPQANQVDASNESAIEPPTANQTNTINDQATTRQQMHMGKPLNRDHAFQQMRLIADFFRENEPHSPISFMIEKTIRWGYLSFPQLMEELVRGNQDIINQIGLLTGMNEDTEVKIPDIVIETPSTIDQNKEIATPAPETEVEKMTEPEQEEEQTSSNISDFQW